MCRCDDVRRLSMANTWAESPPTDAALAGQAACKLVYNVLSSVSYTIHVTLSELDLQLHHAEF